MGHQNPSDRLSGDAEYHAHTGLGLSVNRAEDIGRRRYRVQLAQDLRGCLGEIVGSQGVGRDQRNLLSLSLGGHLVTGSGDGAGDVDLEHFGAFRLG